MSAYVELHAAAKAKAAAYLDRGKPDYSAYAALVREEDSPHVSKAPSRSFRAVLGALASARCSYVMDIARRAEVDQPATTRLLLRMRRLGLATAQPEPAEEYARRGGYKPRRYYTITASGVELARALAPAKRGA